MPKEVAPHAIPGSQRGKARFVGLFLIWLLHKKPMHGYSLMKELREIAISPSLPSSIYAILSRLEKSGMVKSSYDSTGAHTRKLYSTTPAGWALFEKIRETHSKGLLKEFIEVPGAGSKHQVYYTHIRAYAFHFLVIPKRERVIIPVGKQDSLFVAGVQVVCSIITA